MLAYKYNSNTIIAKALKSKASADHLAAIQEVHKYLNQWSIHPKMHIMDNECSKPVKDCIKYEKKIDLRLVSSYLHRANAAKKAIDIFKCYFITELVIVDPQFLLHL